MNIKQKIASGMATGTFVASMMAGSAFASNVVIADNGALSHNGVGVYNSTETTVVQANEMSVTNMVGASASTGGNSASSNTGGESGVVTGAATTTVTVTNTGGDNSAVVNNACGCPEEGTTVRVRDNGFGSFNHVKVKNKKTNTYVQGSSFVVGNFVHAKAKTGKNRSSFNTGDGSYVLTGPATTTVRVTNTGGNNDLQVNP